MSDRFKTQEEMVQEIIALESERDLWKQRCEKLAEAMQNIKAHCETLTNDFQKLGAWNIADKALTSLPRGEKEKTI